MSSETEFPTQRKNFFSLLWGIIRQPKATFEYLRGAGGRQWLWLALIAILLTIAPITASAPITARTAREALEAQFDAQEERGQALTPEMRQQASQISTNPLFTVVFPGILGVVGLVVSWLVWSGALHLLSVMVGGDSHFRAMFKMAVWAGLPLILRGVLQTVFILVTGETISNPGLSGLVAQERPVSEIILQPPSAGTLAIQSFLSQIDLFFIWYMVLLVIGVRVMARFSLRKAILIVAGIWLVLTIVRMLFAALPTLFMSPGF
jgi:hypothetical protein